MQFKSFADFLHMGGYGFYVWAAYGVVCLFIFLNLLNTLKSNKKY